MAHEMIEAEFEAHGNGTAVVVREARTALPMPVLDPTELIEYQERNAQYVVKALKEGTDYGQYQGWDRPCLLQPGAERLCTAFNLAARYEVMESEADHDREVQWEKRNPQNRLWPAKYDGRCSDCGERIAQGAPQLYVKDTRDCYCRSCAQAQMGPEYVQGTSLGLYRYVMRCDLINRDTGEVVGYGIGAASTLETKYVDRPRDCENTVLQVARKRALVQAVRSTLGLSDRFTQDGEDLAATRDVTPPTEPRRGRTDRPGDRQGDRQGGSRRPERQLRQWSEQLAEAVTFEAVWKVYDEADQAAADGLWEAGGDLDLELSDYLTGAFRRVGEDTGKCDHRTVSKLCGRLDHAESDEDLEIVKDMTKEALSQCRLHRDGSGWDSIVAARAKAMERLSQAKPDDRPDQDIDASPSDLEG